ncbi:MAG: putative lipid II flippase FtsW [Elusimicrobia bacterium]|nr:putative lipid II flippase FtsW [Elusimicrobiota bacterium]
MRRKKNKFSSVFPKNLNIHFFDYKLFTAIIFLTLVGLSFLYSASSALAYSKTQSTLFYVKKQLLWSVFSIGIMLFISFIDIEKARIFIPLITVITIILLVITLFMPPIQNTRRWIPLGFMNFQTSEFAKVAFVLYLSDYIDRNYSKIRRLKFFIKPTIIIALMLLLIALEPDIGTPALLFIIAIAVFFIYGAKISHIMTPFIAGISLIVLEIMRHPYRIERMKSFISPWDDPTGKSFQIVQSLVAIGSGWWFGKGPGNSIMKLNYLPESHTDFIFPIIAEEIGFLGVLFILCLFLYVFFRSVKIAKRSTSSFLSILTISSALLITAQSLFNMAMSSGLTPTKGLPLPFFSYGGSSIITTMMLLGFILNTSLRRKNI